MRQQKLFCRALCCTEGTHKLGRIVPKKELKKAFTLCVRVFSGVLCVCVCVRARERERERERENVRVRQSVSVCERGRQTK